MNRRVLALLGLGGFGVGSLAMATGNYLLVGLTPFVAIQAVVVAGVAVLLARARADDSMLTFEDPSLSEPVQRYAPYSLVALGTLTLLVGLLTLVVAVT